MEEAQHARPTSSLPPCMTTSSLLHAGTPAYPCHHVMATQTIVHARTRTWHAIMSSTLGIYRSLCCPHSVPCSTRGLILLKDTSSAHVSSTENIGVSLAASGPAAAARDRLPLATRKADSETPNGPPPEIHPLLLLLVLLPLKPWNEHDTLVNSYKETL